jgi:uncharacterized protein DUF2795
MTGPTDDELRRYLHDATFPAERSRLVAEAIEAGAGQALVDSLRALPGDHLFGSVAEVAGALGPSTQERI